VNYPRVIYEEFILGAHFDIHGNQMAQSAMGSPDRTAPALQ
jgi:hypothetical protein